MGELDFRKVTIRQDIDSFLQSVQEPSVVVFSPRSLKNYKIENKYLTYINYKDLTKKETNIQSQAKNWQDCAQVIAIGGGSCIDVAQYLSTLLNKKFVCIVTMLSTNAFSTNSIIMVQDDNKKRTIKASLADKIILDTKEILNAGKMNLFGLADVLSIYTACNDWDFAEKCGVEKIDYKIYKQAQNILSEALALVKNNTQEDLLISVDKMYDIIGRAGLITNIYGSGRPESGSEHIFASTLERYIDIPHGLAVSIGITLMSIAQGRQSEDIYLALKKLGMYDAIERYNVSDSLIIKVLNEIAPRVDRYTVIDVFDFTPENNQKLINEFRQIVAK